MLLALPPVLAAETVQPLRAETHYASVDKVPTDVRIKRLRSCEALEQLEPEAKPDARG